MLESGPGGRAIKPLRQRGAAGDGGARPHGLLMLELIDC